MTDEDLKALIDSHETLLKACRKAYFVMSGTQLNSGMTADGKHPRIGFPFTIPACAEAIAKAEKINMPIEVIEERKKKPKKEYATNPYTNEIEE